MSDTLGKASTRAGIRELLGKVLPGAPQFDAFCADHFPNVHRQFSSGMVRDDKETLLVERHETAEILHKLRETNAAKTAQFEALLALGADSSRAAISDELLVRILQIVARSAWLPDTLAPIYYSSAPIDWRSDFDDNRGEDLMGRMLARLACALCQSDGAHPILRFVLHLMRIVATSGVPEQTRAFLSWFQDAAAYLGVNASRQHQLQREVETAALRDERELHLVVVMTQRADPTHDLAVSAWRVLVPRGKDRWSAEDAERIDGYDNLYRRTADMPVVMRDLFRDIEADLERAEGRLTIELVAPVELFGCDADRWSLDLNDSTTPPFGADYDVVLRSWDRVYGPSSMRAANHKWRAKWKQIHGPCACVAWACSREDAAAGIARRLHGDGPACVVLSFAPTRDATGAAVLREIISAGAPIAVWPREAPQDEAGFQACVAELTDQKAVSTWHAVVKDYRCAAYKKPHGTHLGHHLAVLRDDPNKLLPDAGARLKKPLRMN